MLLLFGLQGCGKNVISAAPETRYDSSRGHSVVAKARSQIGGRYKYGGSSPQTGFDCSGLIEWSYKQCGIRVPRITEDQAEAGVAVGKNQLRPGDILVFRISSRSGLHTAIYSGNGKFIHSPSSGKRVREEELNGYWTSRYITARRILL